MMRSLAMLVSVFCVATLMSAMLAVGLLWFRGQLTPVALNDIRLALMGVPRETPDEELDESEPAYPSLDEVAEARAIRVLEIATREKELAALKQMVTDQANAVAAARADFDKKKAAFEAELATRNADITSEARESARGILRALPEKQAVENLLQLALEENVILLREMSDKDIARILEEFSKGEEAQAERGREIFEALSKGEPERKFLENTAGRISVGDPTRR